MKNKQHKTLREKHKRKSTEDAWRHKWMDVAPQLKVAAGEHCEDKKQLQP